MVQPQFVKCTTTAQLENKTAHTPSCCKHESSALAARITLRFPAALPSLNRSQ
eukprot:m.150172 g.150172  ORF g.150172 m.150172 type:complete len:53 (+) comp14224_c0_seq1:247-405(+)